MSTVKSKNLQVGTDATATNNFTIYQPSTPDGTLRIGVGNADSPTEVARITADGLRPTGAIALHVGMSTTFSVAHNVWTKVPWDTEEFDTVNGYDNTTNYRYTPGIAGYYWITTNIFMAGATNGGSISSIYKNGSLLRRLDSERNDGTFNNMLTGSTCIYLDEDDYIEIYVYQNSGGTLSMGSGVQTTTFSAALISQA